MKTDLLRKFQMSDRNLHIWPRGEFMMIALPNRDCSFTGNLFAPFDIFEKLKTPEAVLQFYSEQFPDLLRLIGESKLLKDFFISEPKPLISIQVNFTFITHCISVHDWNLYTWLNVSSFTGIISLYVLQCEPFHIGKTALLVGDAAHAMVPFYAQGMNTVSCFNRYATVV